MLSQSLLVSSMFLRKCHLCQMFSNKTKYIFHGIMSDFIYLDLCLITCISCSRHVQSEINPAAKIIKSISAETFNNTFDNIYTNFRSPTTHGTDNGLPFNLQQFKGYSDQKGIKYKVYPYHPQPNTAETLKKPMGKAMKIPHSKHQNRTKNCMLTSYRTTPHIETSQAPRKLTFQHGFQYHFLIAKSTTSSQISKAHRKHLEQQQKRKKKHNASRHSKTFCNK